MSVSDLIKTLSIKAKLCELWSTKNGFVEQLLNKGKWCADVQSWMNDLLQVIAWEEEIPL